MGRSRVVVLLLNGGPLSSDWLKANVPTILEVYYPGQAAGTAIAETLLGRNNPGGVLPYTLYPEGYVNQVALAPGWGLRACYAAKLSVPHRRTNLSRWPQVKMSDMGMRANATTGNPGRTYRFFTGQPLWPFGFGLSYTTFALEWAHSMVGAEARRMLGRPWCAIVRCQRLSFHCLCRWKAVCRRAASCSSISSRRPSPWS